MNKYEKWWLFKYLPDGRQIRKVSFYGPPSGVYGCVELTLDEGTKMFAPQGVNAFTPCKRDLQVFETNPKPRPQPVDFSWLENTRRKLKSECKTAPQFALLIMEFVDKDKLSMYLEQQGYKQNGLFFKLQAYFMDWKEAP